MDPTTRAAYDAGATTTAKVTAVVDSLVGTVTVKVTDSAGNVKGTGTMASPWGIVSQNVLIMGQVASFATTVTGTPAADWVLRFEASARWIEGTFGLTGSGADFVWSLPTWVSGTAGRVESTSVATFKGQTTADRNDFFDIFIQSTGTFGWIVPDAKHLGTFTQGVVTTYDLNQDVVVTQGSDPEYTLLSSAIPDVLLNIATGLITVGPTVPSGTYNMTIDLIDLNAVVQDTLITSVTTDASGSSAVLPWTVGHLFKKDDIPTGTRIVGSTPLQVSVKNRWPDGSVKFAILSGISAAGSVDISRVSSPEPTSTPVSVITAADVGTTSVSLGVYGTVSLATAINGVDLSSFIGTPGNRPATAGKLQDWLVGPILRESHYYAPAPNDPYLGVFWHVRKYADGNIEIETIVENGWVNVSAPTEKTYTASITVNNTARTFHDGNTTAAVTHYHNTRWTRADWKNPATAHTYVLHNVAYIKSTKVVPNYSYPGTPSATVWTTKSPNYNSNIAISEVTEAMVKRPLPLTPCILRTYGYQSGGGEDHSDQVGIVPYPDAVYLRTGDIRALKAVEFNGRGGNRHAVTYRSEVSLELPLPNDTTIYSTYQGSGNGNTPGPVGTFAEIEDEHQPHLGWFAYLCTGRYVFLELNLFEALYNFFRQGTGTPWPYGTSNGRLGSTGLLRSPTMRAIAWQIRTLAGATCACPDDMPLKRELERMFDNNIQWMWDIQTGPWPSGSGQGTNNLGVYWTTNTATYTENYPSTSIPIKDPAQPAETFVRASPWQQGYMTSVMAWSWDMEITSTEKRATHELVRNHGYKFVLGRLGFTYNDTGYSWRRADTYYEPIGYPGPTYAGCATVNTFFNSWKEMYDHFIVYCGATDADDSSPSTQPFFDGPQSNGGFAKIGIITPGQEDYWGTNDVLNIDYHTATRSIIMSLAYATDHGYADAAAKWALIMSTKDYSDPAAQSPLASYPRFVAVPR